jgi:hypothetical protein
MGKKEKLILKLKSVPKDFTYLEMQTILNSLGFRKSKSGKTGGSRVTFIKDNVPIILHKPHPRKELPEYQIKQVLEILERDGLI